MGIGGQSNVSGASPSALRILYSLNKDSIPTLAPDGLLQSNPPVVTGGGHDSTTLPVNVKRGVLGGSVAFIRPDIGANVCGGPVLDGSDYIPNTRPLGLFLNDAAGNAYENTPAPASGKCPYLRGGTVGVKVYETNQQLGGAGDLGWAVGQRVYASVNGYATNRWQDSYEFQWIDGESGSGSADACIEPDVTCLGTVLSIFDSSSTELFIELKY